MLIVKNVVNLFTVCSFLRLSPCRMVPMIRQVLLFLTFDGYFQKSVKLLIFRSKSIYFIYYNWILFLIGITLFWFESDLSVLGASLNMYDGSYLGIANGLQLLTILPRKVHHRCWLCPTYAAVNKMKAPFPPFHS